MPPTNRTSVDPPLTNKQICPNRISHLPPLQHIPIPRILDSPRTLGHPHPLHPRIFWHRYIFQPFPLQALVTEYRPYPTNTFRCSLRPPNSIDHPPRRADRVPLRRP